MDAARLLAWYDDHLQPRIDVASDRLHSVIQAERAVIEDAWDRALSRLPVPSPRRSKQYLIGGIATMALGGELVSLIIGVHAPLDAFTPALPAVLLTGPAGFTLSALGVRGLKREVAAVRARRSHPASKGFIR